MLDVDIANHRVTVEPGVTNLDITRAAPPFGYYYAPDPSSQQVCSIGGNVAENSGGAHCLKYGFTVHHVLGVEAVLPDGELVHLGGRSPTRPGPICWAWSSAPKARWRRRPKSSSADPAPAGSVQTLLAAFDTIDAGGAAVSAIIGAGIIPAAVEMMDSLAIHAAEAAVHPNFPDADTVLIVELDGPAGGSATRSSTVEAMCRRAAHEIRGRATDDRSARASGAAAKRRSRPWAACRRTTTCRTASCRARSCRKVLAHDRAISRRDRACGSATSFMRATAICIR